MMINNASSKWIDSEDTILCWWAYGRGSHKRRLPQTNSLKSSKSSPHEITWDSACAISGSPILSGKIKRKNKEGQLICPWGAPATLLHHHCSCFSTTESSLNQSGDRQTESLITCQPITTSVSFSKCNLWKFVLCLLAWQGCEIIGLLRSCRWSR